MILELVDILIQPGKQAVVPVQGEEKAAPLLGAVAVHFGRVPVEPVVRGAGRLERGDPQNCFEHRIRRNE